MREKLTIENIEKKTTENGKTYHRIKTSNGWLSCWDDAVAEEVDAELKEFNAPFQADVEILERGNFKNLKKLYGKGEKSDAESVNIAKEVMDKPSFYVSYAKDIFIALLNKVEMEGMNKTVVDALMMRSIELVNQAKKAFS